MADHVRRKGTLPHERVHLFAAGRERGRSVGPAAAKIALKELVAIGRQADLAARAFTARISADDHSIPAFTLPTLSPTASTMPAPSWPRTIGCGIGTMV